MSSTSIPTGRFEAGTRHGVSAFRKAVEKVFEGWATWEMEPEQLVAVCDQVAVVVRYHARGRTSGVELAVSTERVGSLE
jgi:predicted ester cyclase